MTPSPCLVWLPADHRLLGRPGFEMPYLVLGDKYARAVRDGAEAQAVLFPLADPVDIPALLAGVDGVMLTGSPSNVEPAHFGQSVADPTLPLDPVRDRLTLALVRACVDQGVPLLGVCRGFQEINVALGGSLHQTVQAVPGLMDHREPQQASMDEQYAPRHWIDIEPGSEMEAWAGARRVMVNSLHGQGVDRLAPGLRVLARAPDGLVEAFAIDTAPVFACATQWHPEWRVQDNPFYWAIFKAFGRAVRQRQVARLRDARAFATAPDKP